MSLATVSPSFNPYNAEEVALCYIVLVLAAGAIAAAVAGLAYIFGLFGKEPTS